MKQNYIIEDERGNYVTHSYSSLDEAWHHAARFVRDTGMATRVHDAETAHWYNVHPEYVTTDAGIQPTGNIWVARGGMKVIRYTPAQIWEACMEQ